MPGIVHVAEQQLDDPESLTATMAHQLAHAWLPSEALTWRDVREREWLADLVAVCLGLGVFMAQAVIRDMSDAEGHFRCRSMRRFGYLPARRVGYAMALFAWVRGETRPAWRTELRLDAQVAFANGLRYLQRTEDSVFTCRNRQSPARAASYGPASATAGHGQPVGASRGTLGTTQLRARDGRSPRGDTLLARFPAGHPPGSCPHARASTVMRHARPSLR